MSGGCQARLGGGGALKATGGPAVAGIRGETMEVTHELYGERYIQLVDPGELRRVLRQQGSGVSRPSHFRPGDEWTTGTQACPWCRAHHRGSHEPGCPEVIR
jgi:hypothetical protein